MEANLATAHLSCCANAPVFVCGHPSLVFAWLFMGDSAKPSVAGMKNECHDPEHKRMYLKRATETVSAKLCKPSLPDEACQLVISYADPANLCQDVEDRRRKARSLRGFAIIDKAQMDVLDPTYKLVGDPRGDPRDPTYKRWTAPFIREELNYLFREKPMCKRWTEPFVTAEKKVGIITYYRAANLCPRRDYRQRTLIGLDIWRDLCTHPYENDDMGTKSYVLCLRGQMLSCFLLAMSEKFPQPLRRWQDNSLRAPSWQDRLARQLNEEGMERDGKRLRFVRDGGVVPWPGFEPCFFFTVLIR